MKVDTEDVFYVHISEPVEIRKNTLESSRQLVKLLQRYEMIRDLRIRKADQVNLLRKNFKELTLLIAKLKQEMPKVNVRLREKEAPAHKTHLAHPQHHAAAPKQKLDPKKIGVSHLEEELRQIEAKLGKLK